jgi:hypothetical protein
VPGHRLALDGHEGLGRHPWAAARGSWGRPPPRTTAFRRAPPAGPDEKGEAEQHRHREQADEGEREAAVGGPGAGGPGSGPGPVETRPPRAGVAGGPRPASRAPLRVGAVGEGEGVVPRREGRRRGTRRGLPRRAGGSGPRRGRRSRARAELRRSGAGLVADDLHLEARPRGRREGHEHPHRLEVGRAELERRSVSRGRAASPQSSPSGSPPL